MRMALGIFHLAHKLRCPPFYSSPAQFCVPEGSPCPPLWCHMTTSVDFLNHHLPIEWVQGESPQRTVNTFPTPFLLDLQRLTTESLCFNLSPRSSATYSSASTTNLFCVGHWSFATWSPNSDSFTISDTRRCHSRGCMNRLVEELPQDTGC